MGERSDEIFDGLERLRRVGDAGAAYAAKIKQYKELVKAKLPDIRWQSDFAEYVGSDPVIYDRYEWGDSAPPPLPDDGRAAVLSRRIGDVVEAVEEDREPPSPSSDDIVALGPDDRSPFEELEQLRETNPNAYPSRLTAYRKRAKLLRNAYAGAIGEFSYIDYETGALPPTRELSLCVDHFHRRQSAPRGPRCLPRGMSAEQARVLRLLLGRVTESPDGGVTVEPREAGVAYRVGASDTNSLVSEWDLTPKLLMLGFAAGTEEAFAFTTKAWAWYQGRRETDVQRQAASSPTVDATGRGAPVEDYVAWCDAIVGALLAVEQRPPWAGVGVTLEQLALAVFDDQAEAPAYFATPRGRALGDAVADLCRIRLLEKRTRGACNDSHLEVVLISTHPAWGERLSNPDSFRRRQCSELLSEEDRAVLDAVNRLSERRQGDHILLAEVRADELRAKLGMPYTPEGARSVAQSLVTLDRKGFIERIGSEGAKSTYLGLVRQHHCDEGPDTAMNTIIARLASELGKEGLTPTSSLRLPVRIGAEEEALLAVVEDLLVNAEMHLDSFKRNLSAPELLFHHYTLGPRDAKPLLGALKDKAANR